MNAGNCAGSASISTKTNRAQQLIPVFLQIACTFCIRRYCNGIMILTIIQYRCTQNLVSALPRC